MNFSEALKCLKEGKKLYRSGWNGKGMWIEIQFPDAKSKMTVPYIFMTCPKGSTNQYKFDTKKVERIPWIVGQGDIMANDWYVKEGDPCK